MIRWKMRSHFKKKRKLNRLRRNLFSKTRISQISTRLTIKEWNISWLMHRLSCWMFLYLTIMRASRLKGLSLRSMMKVDSRFHRKASIKNSWPQANRVLLIASIMSLKSRPTYSTLTWNQARLKEISDKFRMLSISKVKKRLMKSLKMTSSQNWWDPR